MLPEVITGFVNLTHCFCCRMWSCTVFDNSFEKMVTRSRVNYGHVTNVFFEKQLGRYFCMHFVEYANKHFQVSFCI